MRYFVILRVVFVLVAWTGFLAKAQELPDFVHLVDQFGASVVNISTIQKAPEQQEFKLEGMPDEAFQEFFRHFFGEEGMDKMPRSENDGDGDGDEVHRSLGSGFAISADGYILTNYHVIKDAKEIIVKLRDRRQLEAKLVGGDPESDLALLKVAASDLLPVRVGSSKNLKVGAWVLAIGSPFGFENSVTAGIVSAKGRSLSSERYVPFIQTDVAINPGNSGGPLFNLAGEVVGINAQILSRTGGYMGVSFAIPIDIAMGVVEQLKTSGKVSRGFLGITFQGVSRELAESFGLDTPRGALVASVIEESPAAKAGFKDGDIVLSFNGQEINEASQLPPLVGQAKIGEKINVAVFRNKRIKTLTVEIGELPESEKMAEQSIKDEAIANELKLEVRGIKEEEKKEHDVDHGVLVTRLGKGPAQKAGIKAGDVLLSLNHQTLRNTEDFKVVVDKLKGSRLVSALVSRSNDGKRYLAIKLDADKE